MRWGTLLLVVASVSAACVATAACGSGGKSGAQGGGDAGGSAGESGGGSSSGSSSGAADGGSTTLAFPQLVQGTARVDTAAFAKIPLVVVASGASPASVSVALDGAGPAAATSSDGKTFTATLDVSSVAAGTHALSATATSASGGTLGTASGSLVVAAGSLKFTTFAKDGPAYSDHLLLAPSGDRLAYTWVSVANGSTHQLYLNYLDGAGTRLLPSDVVLNDPADEPLSGYTAFSSDSIGVVYHVNDAASGHWRVKMRVVDASGAEKVPAQDLTQGQAAFSLAAAGVDPGGFSAAWLHISPPPSDGGALPPVELRYARWDTAKSALVGPIVVDSDQPAPAGSTQGPQTLEPLAEMGVACNSSVCVVLYSRDVYDATVQLNVPKLFLGVVSLASGQLAGTPQPVEAVDWDTQMFGQQIVAQPDGSFVLVYTATDTAAAVTPESPCDESIERDLLFAARVDATGKLEGAPKPVFDFQGSREYPRIAAHPAGWALFWEDQRSECDATGQHIGMAMNVAAPDLGSLLDPYLEAPGSIGLPPEYPTLAVTGTSFVAAWSDDRDGQGLTQPAPELFLETYWR